jgi:hypothetical protein
VQREDQVDRRELVGVGDDLAVDVNGLAEAQLARAPAAAMALGERGFGSILDLGALGLGLQNDDTDGEAAGRGSSACSGLRSRGGVHEGGRLHPRVRRAPGDFADAQPHMLEQWARACSFEFVAIHQDRVSGGLRQLRSELADGVATT